jgi:hypothetical protein
MTLLEIICVWFIVFQIICNILLIQHNARQYRKYTKGLKAAWKETNEYRKRLHEAQYRLEQQL